MILSWLGWLFEGVGRARGGESGSDLAHLGGELRRLDRPPAQALASSR